MPDWNLPYQMVRTDVDKETVGQYTGLKDKNGKEIYEGDIVKVFTSKKWRIGIIIYEHSGFTIDVTNNKELKYGRTSIIENLTEVIGNIYDNPELLREMYEVYFAYGGFRLKPKYNSKARGYWLEDDNEVEIVGNKFDNPELLEEGE